MDAIVAPVMFNQRILELLSYTPIQPVLGSWRDTAPIVQQSHKIVLVVCTCSRILPFISDLYMGFYQNDHDRNVHGHLPETLHSL